MPCITCGIIFHIMVRTSATASDIFFSQLHISNSRLGISAAGTVRVKTQTSEMCKVSSINPPPPLKLLEICGASTASHRQNYTSLYSFDCEFRRCRNSLLFNTSGIRAAAEKSSTYQNGHGCPWFYAAAMFLQRKNSRPEVYTDVHFWTGYFQKLSAKVFSKAFILYGCITASALSFFFVFFILFLENLRRHLPILICIISQSTPRVRFVSINSPHD